jgi:hypothetical protein
MPEETGLVILEFLQNDGIYQAGETASFGPQVAKQILGKRRVRREGEEGRPVACVFTGTPMSAAAEPVAPSQPKPLVSVQFTQWCGRYGAGETASFTADVAKVLVEGGQWEGMRRGPVAVYVPVAAPVAPAAAELSLEPAFDEKPAPRVDRMVRGDNRHDKRG